MIVHPARALTRVAALIILPALALVSLAFAVAAIIGGQASRSLASQLGLSDAWRELGAFLTETAPQGNSTVLLAGAGAVLAAILLMIGALAPARERELTLTADDSLAARRRALRAAAADLATGVRGTTDSSVKLKTRRIRSGGRLRVRADRHAQASPSQVNAALRERIEPLADAFALHSNVSSRNADTSRKRAT